MPAGRWLGVLAPPCCLPAKCSAPGHATPRYTATPHDMPVITPSPSYTCSHTTASLLHAGRSTKKCINDMKFEKTCVTRTGEPGRVKLVSSVRKAVQPVRARSPLARCLRGPGRC
ncbi:hypothetical protein E2C01_098252 [Portunus trituberculatus]|uniref:Uncharacterized protein n=1 Tax=Portunus trituberculatus TaxID=210409 RepID=A0A5B7K769_PORTR|nr:hypothetical protein [Portunus trituberculatus]